MTETTYASNMDDLVAQIGELDHKLDKLNHKCRVAADMIGKMRKEIEDSGWEIGEKIVDIQHLQRENNDLMKQVEQIPDMKITESLQNNRINEQNGEIQALKWAIRKLTEK